MIYKHVMVEELLQLLIAEVDTDLFKTIVIKDLKACNIQASNVLYFLHCWVN